MNTQKLINSALAVGGLALMAAGAQAQQGVFNYATTFTPNPITSTDPNSSILVTSGADVMDNAGQFGTQITLVSFNEASTTAPPAFGTVNATPFTVGLTLTPVSGGGSLTRTFTGNFNAMFNNQGTISSVAFTGPGTQTFNFDGNGIFTVSNLTFNPPGPTGSVVPGTIAAQVNFTPGATPPPAVPEPASMVPFALGGLALLGLMARKGRRSSMAAV